MPAAAARLTLGALAICTLAAAQLPHGQIIDRVATAGDPQQTYALYLPANYVQDRYWPILYCLDPRARGRIPVERFAEAAEKSGWIVAGSNNCRNGPLEPARQAIQAMFADTHARFLIDDSRVYVAGFSGGARLALSLGQNGRIAGVIACGAGFAGTPPKQIPFKLFAAAGLEDFNYDELYGLSLHLARRGVPHRFETFDGGHDWLPKPLAANAVDFLTGKLPPLTATPSKDQEQQARRYLHLLAEVQGANDTVLPAYLHDLRKDALKPGNDPDARIARRVLAGVFVGWMQAASQAIADRQFEPAARILETAVLAEPDYPYGWYTLALARAGAGNRRRALDALEQALSKGFRDREQLETEPLFAKLRNDARFRALLEHAKPSEK